MGYSVKRYHDFSCGHRVVGHEGKCRYLHGHNYRVTFTCEALEESDPLDGIGRVIDFGVIKDKLCEWLEQNWDHKFLMWNQDELMTAVVHAMSKTPCFGNQSAHDVDPGLDFDTSFVHVPFNPTAENMAAYLVQEIAPLQLKGTGIIVTHCKVEETRKCSASYNLRK